MALSPELQALLDQELSGLDVQGELAKLGQPDVPPQAQPQVAAPAAPVAPAQAAPVEQAPYPLPPAQEAADPDSWGSAIGRGVDETQANIGGSIRVAGELTGSQFLTDYGQQMVEQNKEEASQYGVPTNRSYKDVDPSDVGSIGQYVKNLVGEGAASMGGVMAGSVAGAKAGGLAGAPGRVAGGVIGAFLSSLGINVGALDNQMKELDPKSSHPTTALLGGAGLSVLDTFGAGVAVRPLLKHIGEDAAYKLLVQSGMPKQGAIEAISQAAKHTAISAGAEGATSGIQSALQDTMAYGATGQKQDPGMLLENAINAALGGSALGGAVGGAAKGIDVLANRNNAVDSAYVAPAPTAPTAKQMKPKGIGAKLWDAMGNSSTALLDPLAQASPTAKKFKEMFRADMSTKTASEKTIFEDTELQAGKWTSEFDRLTHRMGDKKINALIDEASSPNPTSPEALRMRSLLDDVRNEATNRGGLQVGNIPDYMPFGLDPKRVNTPEFLQEITPYYKDQAAAEEAIRNWNTEIESPDRGNTAPEVKKLVTQNPTTGAWEADPRYRVKGDPETLRVKFAQSDATPQFGHLEKSRSFGQVPQNALNKYTLNQTGKKRKQEIIDYFEGAAHRIAGAERFGSNGEKANTLIAASVKEAQDAGKRVSKEEVDRMYNLVNAYSGMYGRIKDENLKNISAGVAAVTTMSRLPLAGLSTLTEFSIPFAKAGVARSLSQVFPTLGEGIRQAVGGVFKFVPPSETGRLMSDLNMTLASSTSVMADRIGATMFNNLGQKAVRFEFLVNGMSLMTHLNRIFATKTAEVTFTNNLMDLAGGLPFTSANGAMKLAQLREMGIDVATPQDALDLIAPTWPHQVVMAQNAKALAIRRFVDQSVLDPTFADKPMWMSNGMAQMGGLLKGYPAAFGNIILPMMKTHMGREFTGSWSNTGVAAAGMAFSLGLMMALGTLQDELKSAAKYAGAGAMDTRTEEQKMLDVFMQQTPLQVSLAWDMATSERRGSSPLEVLAGPVAGMANEAGSAVYKTISSVADDPTLGHIWKFIYQQTPARPFVAGKEALSEITGLNQ
ncbi:virion structural protein [Pseudomonas phage Bjorn]|uniref:Uncharacterized protein n=1 Tax=Pseudomonas phage Bjorn TaxID=2079288 RepID=A0A2K9VHD6_9CAUD|nr:virion structural protein [Pseudomonas phage Bjorn]AUV61763.1 hypothetical protein PsPhBjorn_gp53 [Pseudomonas phage Bjorn]